MSLFGQSEARPYVVTVREIGGEEVKVRIVAYDAAEAMVAAQMKHKARGAEVDTVVTVEPDEDELARRRKQEFVDAVSRGVLDGLGGSRSGRAPQKVTDPDPPEAK